jgi:cell wall-associated NlpC family hydrolase
VASPHRLGRGGAAVVLLVLVALGVSLQLPAAGAKPGPPPPRTIASVTAKLDALGRQTERLAELYNKARLDVAGAEAAVSRADKAAADAQTRLDQAHAKFIAMITSQYENGTQNAASALLTSGSGQNYLDTLTVMDIAARQQSDVVRSMRAAKSEAATARQRAAAALHTAEAERRAVVEQRAKAAAETTKFKALLATLTAAQRRTFATRHAAPPVQAAAAVSSAVSTVHAGSTAAQRAVSFALAQVGKPYVFGAAGPGSYDCSGLTMAAWQAAGVSLPHLAADQYNYGTHVSVSQLQPGDLVFMYNPIGHVAMYIGHGMLVSAPQPGENVQVVPLSYFLSDVVGATRLA